MTPLARILAERIAKDGPMSLASYMAECLLHPDHGYYTTQTPFGAAGDFTTAPEISQMFGELLGLALAQYWLDLGQPSPFTLAEFGPGRGTLMADVLRATKGVPGFHAAMQVVLLEASPRLRTVQAETLQSGAPQWIDRPSDLPNQPLFLLANEFFDALPIHQYQRDSTGWRERLVGLQGDKLTLGLSTTKETAELDARFADYSPGAVVELCPQALPYVTAISDRIARHGGLALIVDYGGWRSQGDTFQAVKAHGFADPFAEPGQADLTAHVDFEYLAQASPLAHSYTPQGAFLTALGIDARAARLAARLTGAALENHTAAHRRLTDPAEMGRLFQVLGLYRPGAPLPPGFA